MYILAYVNYTKIIKHIRVPHKLSQNKLGTIYSVTIWHLHDELSSCSNHCKKYKIQLIS